MTLGQRGSQRQRILEPLADEPSAGAEGPAQATAPAPQATAPAPQATAPAPPDTSTPGFLERGRLRRRARYLRQLREIQFRDLGGFMVELHRFDRQRPDLVAAKVHGAATIDTELRAVERALGGGGVRELREAGIGGACASCGTVHGSSDNYCAACGEPLGLDDQPGPGDQPGLEDQPALQRRLVLEEQLQPGDREGGGHDLADLQVGDRVPERHGEPR